MLSNKELAEVFENIAIPAYRKCIEDIRGKGLDEAKNICRSRWLHLGVCCFMEYSSIDIYDHPLIEKYYSGEIKYWCKRPALATSTAEIISLHERRIEIMQEIIDYVKNEILK